MWGVPTVASTLIHAFVVQEAVLRHLFKARAGPAIVGIGVDGNASTGGEKAHHLNIARLHKPHKVFHDDIDTILVEIAMVAEREEIELQAFALHHPDIRNITYYDFGKVRLPGDGTKRGELGAVELHPVVVILMPVLKSLQHFWSIVGAVCCFMAKGLKVVVAHLFF